MPDRPQCAKCLRMLCYPNLAVDEKPSFEVVSVCCKAGAIPKERIGIKPE